MQVQNRYISILYKCGAFAAGLTGILLQCGVGTGRLDLSVLNYFTLMSNVLCAVYFLLSAIWLLIRKRSIFPAMKGALLLCISVTGLVYHFMLAGRFEMQGTLFWSNTLLHYIVPLLTVLDWLLFDEKGRYTKRDPLKWTLFPAAYFLYVNIRVKMGGILGPYGNRYPYFFMDPDLLGWGPVLLIAFGMGLAFLALGYFILWMDNRLKHVSRNGRT